MSTVVETVHDLLVPILDQHHFELVDVEFVKEGSSWYLRVFIDKPNGIDLEDCALVNDALSEKLDSIDPDPIPQAYFLDVSSPGAERPLKKETDFQNALGEYIHISLYQAVDGEKIYQGILKALDQETLTLAIKIKTRQKEVTFNRKEIAKARLAIEF
ncbi:ribosome maturation factor RimP [Latilactobacillus sakei]|uniref:Ribosome maturation factor RimP n=1 Tax=Latilactobacillus sakei TaxID=1599 RepID=A0AAE8J5X9_LATSK|nr:ribosome maturation factor RimP [Latilactobacillus sakei]ASN12831.1 ribosome maturation factor RimP [Latilactobacillus sakei]MCM1635047.1 ribosome maturation factor RimP [Latilactobacillus sakei]PKX61832.1 ribosome maturation factor RimP [Latilactobacillus sakei]PKX69221.1 ribosome maturation factor RimP [Latilactobacillus sakei]PKX72610.1 ribosome maturation factor RimP [Latilactobacillus sakei]